MTKKFFEMITHDLEEMENRLLDLAYLSIRQRVARALLKINESRSYCGKNGCISIARRDISSIVGTATETLNRTLGDFRDEGLIEISGEGIKIVGKPKLERLLH